MKKLSRFAFGILICFLLLLSSRVAMLTRVRIFDLVPLSTDNHVWVLILTVALLCLLAGGGIFYYFIGSKYLATFDSTRTRLLLLAISPLAGWGVTWLLDSLSHFLRWF
jgi:hypothetical protein